MTPEPAPAQPLDPAYAELFDAIGEIVVDANTLSSFRGAPIVNDGDEPRDDTVEITAIPLSNTTIRVTRSTALRSAPTSLVADRPAIVWMHGGGYVMGSAAQSDQRLGRWCRDLGVVAVSVDYRLAPEHPYPAALDDCVEALRWIHAQADELGVDRHRIGVGGTSAGAGLAAALAQRTRDEHGPLVAFQLLNSPMLDDRLITPSSRTDGLVVWTRASNEFGWSCYLGDLWGTKEVPPHAAPARAADLRGLPPTLITVGGCDGFRDENVDYAAHLNQAGVPTELHVYPGAPHGIEMWGPHPILDQITVDTDRWLARMTSAG